VTWRLWRFITTRKARQQDTARQDNRQNGKMSNEKWVVGTAQCGILGSEEMGATWQGTARNATKQPNAAKRGVRACVQVRKCMSCAGWCLLAPGVPCLHPDLHEPPTSQQPSLLSLENASVNTLPWPIGLAGRVVRQRGRTWPRMRDSMPGNSRNKQTNKKDLVGMESYFYGLRGGRDGEHCNVENTDM